MDTPHPEVIDVESLRRRASIPLQALSTATGIPRNTLRRKLANPSTFTLAEFTAVATHLNIPPSDWWVAA